MGRRGRKVWGGSSLFVQSYGAGSKVSLQPMGKTFSAGQAAPSSCLLSPTKS